MARRTVPFRSRRQRPQPRRLDDGDWSAFMEAASDRRKPMSREQIIEAVKARNPHRWWRLQWDYKWLEKQMKRLGQNPEDARELL